MATVVFYEKPGCANNARQKSQLRAAGHELDVRDLLTTAWTSEELRIFFGARPVAEWINRAAPAVKNGQVIPEALDEATALALMLADPLLIRRPLLRVGDRYAAGFEPERIAGWLGLTLTDPAHSAPEACVKELPCPTPRHSAA